MASGNLVTNPENSPYGDSIVRLTPDLRVVSYHAPRVFIGDDDFGSTPMLFQKPGCPPQLAAEQKNGSLHLYDRDNISAGPRQTLVLSEGGDFVRGGTPVSEFIGVPAYSPQLKMMFVSNPTGTPDGSYTNGMVAFRINSACVLEKAWNTTAGADIEDGGDGHDTFEEGSDDTVNDQGTDDIVNDSGDDDPGADSSAVVTATTSWPVAPTTTRSTAAAATTG